MPVGRLTPLVVRLLLWVIGIGGACRVLHHASDQIMGKQTPFTSAQWFLGAIALSALGATTIYCSGNAPIAPILDEGPPPSDGGSPNDAGTPTDGGLSNDAG